MQQVLHSSLERKKIKDYTGVNFDEKPSIVPGVPSLHRFFLSTVVWDVHCKPLAGDI